MHILWVDLEIIQYLTRHAKHHVLTGPRIEDPALGIGIEVDDDVYQALLARNPDDPVQTIRDLMTADQK